MKMVFAVMLKGEQMNRLINIAESLADGAYGYVDTKEIYDAHTIVEAE